MAKPEKTKDRKKCGIVENKIGDKMKDISLKEGEEEFSFVSEEVLYDDDGFIIGVNKLWQ